MFFIVGDEERLPLFVILLVICELLIYLALRRAHRVDEYLSGYSVDVRHHEAWTEKVEYYESYTDSNGRTQTRRKVRYVYHPDIWFTTLNTGEQIDIYEEHYLKICNIWGTGEEWFYPEHVNCVSGGGGQICHFNGKYENGITATYKGLYINYVRNSNSIFKLNRVSKSEAQRLGLIDYPPFDVDSLDIDAVIASPLASIVNGAYTHLPQRDIQLINAFEGDRAEIHIFVLLFDASQGIGVAMKQREYWHGGNKNEFVVCLGIGHGKDSKSPLRVEWCKAFSWCDAPRLESATESWFIAHPDLDFKVFAKWLRGNISLWKRKEFSDFKYLGKRLSPTRRWLVALLTIALSALLAYIVLYVR